MTKQPMPPRETPEDTITRLQLMGVFKRRDRLAAFLRQMFAKRGKAIAEDEDKTNPGHDG